MPPSIVQKVRQFLVALVCALITVACAKTDAPSDPSGSPSRAATNPTHAVQLGYQRIGAPFLLKTRSHDLEKRLGKEHATVSWKEFKHGPALLEAINAGEVDVGYVGETPPVFAQAGNVPFVYVATDPPAPRAEALVVRKDSPIQSVSALRGKKVALNRGSNVHYLLVKALESVKLSIKDVDVVYLAPGDARPAFETGQVDAWVIWDPFLAAAELAGARVLVSGEGLVDNHLFYVVRREFAERHPELVRVVLDEYRALSDWERKNPEEAARVLARASGIAYEALLLSERRHSYAVLPITDTILDKQQAIADTFKALELMPKAIRVRDAVLPALVATANP